MKCFSPFCLKSSLLKSNVQTTDVRFEVVRSARCVDLFVFLHDAAEGTESRDNTEFKKTEITDTGKIRWIRDSQCQF